MKDPTPVDVLICGAGAAGLTLAIDLARRGVRFRLIDKLDQPFAGSRGKGIQPRTQEVFEDLGVIDRLTAMGGHYPAQRVHHADGTWRDGQGLVVEAPSAGEPYRMPLLVPQNRTEAVLRARLAAFGHAPDQAHELVSFTQDAAGVEATIRTPDGVEVRRCRYLIGADGGRSTIRQALKIDFAGRSLGVRAIVADIQLDGLARDVWHQFNPGDMQKHVSFCPLPQSDLFQLQAPVPTGGDVDLSPGGLQSFIDARVPQTGLAVLGVAWASAYSMSAWLAARFRVGRVFLVGDAAHVHPPTGGQGLNTSVQDAYNLGWKLGAVLAGAPETLLDTFEEERRPIAGDMLRLASDLLDAAKRGEMRRGREVQQLDLGYGASSLSLNATAGPRALRAGDRAPDLPLIGAGGQRRRLFDLLQGPHWTLIASGPAPVSLARKGLHIHEIGTGLALRDPIGQFSASYGLADGDMVLIRPDGYVGAVMDAAGLARFPAYSAWLR